MVFKRVLSWLYACFILVLQWGAGTGIIYYCVYPVITNKFSHANCFPKVRCVISYLYYVFCSLLTHGDVETNPGPKKSHWYFSCCLWNVNSLISHNILKVSLIEAYNTVHKYDFIRTSETYFDFSVESEDDDLRINDYKLIRMDHPLNTKKRWCLYVLQRVISCENDKYLLLTRMFTLWSYDR